MLYDHSKICILKNFNLIINTSDKSDNERVVFSET